MRGRADAAGAVVHPARILAGIVEVVAQGLAGDLAAAGQHQRRRDNQRDRREAGDRIEGQLAGLQRGVRRMRRQDHDQGIAIGRAGGGRGGADDAVGAGRFSTITGWPRVFARLGDQPGGDVGGAAGGIGDDDAQRPGRVVGGAGGGGKAEAGRQGGKGAARQVRSAHGCFPDCHSADA